MYCKFCGRAIKDDANFCPFCGTKNEDHQEEVVERETTLVEKGPWKNFAKAGMTLGIISISTFFICFPSLLCGIPGIVLSALGLRSKENKGKATSGLVLSIIGFILGYIMYFIYLMSI